MTFGMIQGKVGCGNQRGKILNELIKWLNVGGATDALKAIRDRDTWKVMIAQKSKAPNWLRLRIDLSNVDHWSRF